MANHVHVIESSVLGDQKASIRSFLCGSVFGDTRVDPLGKENGVPREVPSTDGGSTQIELGDHVGEPPSHLSKKHTEVDVHVRSSSETKACSPATKL